MTEKAEALPELRDAMLDTATLRQLCFDIHSVASIIDVRVKGAPAHHAGEPSASFEQAIADLERGSIAGVQVRYLHKGEEWWDTLMRAPQGFRLVRVRAPSL
jgi:hypothetical protein